jgi:hypothetical protein
MTSIISSKLPSFFSKKPVLEKKKEESTTQKKSFFNSASKFFKRNKKPIINNINTNPRLIPNISPINNRTNREKMISQLVETLKENNSMKEEFKKKLKEHQDIKNEYQNLINNYGKELGFNNLNNYKEKHNIEKEKERNMQENRIYEEQKIKNEKNRIEVEKNRNIYENTIKATYVNNKSPERIPLAEAKVVNIKKKIIPVVVNAKAVNIGEINAVEAEPLENNNLYRRAITVNNTETPKYIKMQKYEKEIFLYIFSKEIELDKKRSDIILRENGELSITQPALSKSIESFGCDLNLFFLMRKSPYEIIEENKNKSETAIRVPFLSQLQRNDYFSKDLASELVKSNKNKKPSINTLYKESWLKKLDGNIGIYRSFLMGFPEYKRAKNMLDALLKEKKDIEEKNNDFHLKNHLVTLTKKIDILSSILSETHKKYQQYVVSTSNNLKQNYDNLERERDDIQNEITNIMLQLKKNESLLRSLNESSNRLLYEDYRKKLIKEEIINENGNEIEIKSRSIFAPSIYSKKDETAGILKTEILKSYENALKKKRNNKSRVIAEIDELKMKLSELEERKINIDKKISSLIQNNKMIQQHGGEPITIIVISTVFLCTLTAFLHFGIIISIFSYLISCMNCWKDMIDSITTSLEKNDESFINDSEEIKIYKIRIKIIKIFIIGIIKKSLYDFFKSFVSILGAGTFFPDAMKALFGKKIVKVHKLFMYFAQNMINNKTSNWLTDFFSKDKLEKQEISSQTEGIIKQEARKYISKPAHNSHFQIPDILLKFSKNPIVAAIFEDKGVEPCIGLKHRSIEVDSSNSVKFIKNKDFRNFNIDVKNFDVYITNIVGFLPNTVNNNKKKMLVEIFKHDIETGKLVHIGISIIPIESLNALYGTKNIKSIPNQFMEGIDNIKNKFDVQMEELTLGMEKTSSNLQKKISQTKNEIKDSETFKILNDMFEKLLNNYKTNGPSFFSPLTNKIGTVGQKVSTELKEVGQKVSTGFKEAGQKVSKGVDYVREEVSTGLNKIGEKVPFITNKFKKFNFIRQLNNLIKSLFEQKKKINLWKSSLLEGKKIKEKGKEITNDDIDKAIYKYKKEEEALIKLIKDSNLLTNKNKNKLFSQNFKFFSKNLFLYLSTNKNESLSENLKSRIKKLNKIEELIKNAESINKEDDSSKDNLYRKLTRNINKENLNILKKNSSVIKEFITKYEKKLELQKIMKNEKEKYNLQKIELEYKKNLEKLFILKNKLPISNENKIQKEELEKKMLEYKKQLGNEKYNLIQSEIYTNYKKYITSQKINEELKEKNTQYTIKQREENKSTAINTFKERNKTKNELNNLLQKYGKITNKTDRKVRSKYIELKTKLNTLNSNILELKGKQKNFGLKTKNNKKIKLTMEYNRLKKNINKLKSSGRFGIEKFLNKNKKLELLKLRHIKEQIKNKALSLGLVLGKEFSTDKKNELSKQLSSSNKDELSKQFRSTIGFNNLDEKEFQNIYNKNKNKQVEQQFQQQFQQQHAQEAAG